MMGAGANAGDAAMFAGMGMLNAGAAGGMASLGDMQMCEIEVQPGDVEAQYATVPADFGQSAWTTNQQSPGFGSNTSPPGSAPPQQQGQQRPATANRASIGGPPSGFTMGSRPHTAHHHSNSGSISSSMGGFVGSMNGSASGSAEEYVASMSSMSAPSHKQAFDHAGMYPPGLLDGTNPSSSTNPQTSSTSTSTASGSPAIPVSAVNSAGNPVQGTPALVNAALAGPIRRHRSMTPSLIGRTGAESIRRPMSTVSNGSNGAGSAGEGGSGGSSPAPGSVSMAGMMGMNPMAAAAGAGARGYHHSYGAGVAFGNTGSRGGSTHSSPAVYNVPLGSASAGGDPSLQQPQQQQQEHVLRRSDSRTSFGAEQERMFVGSGVARTESPGSFIQQQQQAQQQQQQGYHESPAVYTMELPNQHGMYRQDSGGGYGFA
ncbi:hypothetical protein NP233_g9437 [Leucocoprinus birnbaumii]|uniref:Uncharacterized protein n=1 Tax=Leucocoprinus birnbaumii TaxID=56174 RepID=A0AAD5VKL4_9AGAR|nr:hypothetical protein NP233_g9437 [Leucocoprinus birnbaumii]